MRYFRHSPLLLPMAIHIRQKLLTSGETVLLSNGDLILLTNEVNAVDNGIYTFDTTCAVAAACDHLKSDSG